MALNGYWVDTVMAEPSMMIVYDNDNYDGSKKKVDRPAACGAVEI
jgi:hypothetical protein